MARAFCRNCGRVVVIRTEGETRLCLGCGEVGDFSDTHPKHEYSANDRRFLRSIRISADDAIEETDDGA